MAPKVGTVVTYLFYLLPLYVLVYAPLSRTLFGGVKEDRGRMRDVEQHEIADKSGNGHSREAFVPAHELQNLTCPEHYPDVHIFSREPLVIHIPNFLSDAEVEHLLKMSEGNYVPSTVWKGEAAEVDPKVRVSEHVLLERDDVVKCIEARAWAFQGWRPDLSIERMKSQRYGVSGHYVHHYDFLRHEDWSSKATDRVSTFMVYLQADCTGGGTNFPYLPAPKDPRWCEFIECDAEEEKPGVTFKPVKGAAVYWENLREDGSGYAETWHADLPVKSGTKVGLNIWSWYQRKGS